MREAEKSQMLLTICLLFFNIIMTKKEHIVSYNFLITATVPKDDMAKC